MSADLPIDAVLPDLLAALRERTGAVLIAPPGAGKTTAVAPALLGQPWCTGQVIVTSPRRVAARAAAERMAELMGEKAGETVGYLTRLDSKQSARTRILVVTEAILVNRLLDDAELSGVSALLFDEAHERHLDGDLGLALALETRAVLREDLRVVVMSATIDGARFADLIGPGTPVIESAGKAFPLEIRWLGSAPAKRIEDAMADAVMQAWRETAGDLLAFLPGVREIERVRERLELRLADTPILPLHGQVEPGAQRAAIRRDPQGRRRIVLATSIAETSLTLDGVSVVVDSGLARGAAFDKAAGTTHLVTSRASQAAAAQRAGRAARQGPGVAYRLWEAAAHAGRPAFQAPEMLTADLAPLVLALAQWGAADPAGLPWLDPPPPAAAAAARSALASLGAIGGDGRITAHGRAMAQLAMAPGPAHMVLFAAQNGAARDGAELALLLQERGLGGRGEDLAQRLSRWRGDRSPSATAARKLAARWARRAEELTGQDAAANAPTAGVLLAEGFPDRVARRRGPDAEEWLSAGGRAYRLERTSPLAGAEWLAIGDAQGSAQGARITAAIELPYTELTRWLDHRIEERCHVRWIAEREAAEPVRERRLGAIVLSRGHDPSAAQGAVTALLVDHFRREGLAALPLSPACRTLLARARYAGIEALSEPALKADAEGWLGDIAGALNSLRKLDPAAIRQALHNRLTYQQRMDLERYAPAEFTSPAGTSHAIDYAGDDAPSVEVRVQALFGLEVHPMIGTTPLLLKLTSPAGRPLQSTRDLPGFWRGSWADVKKDMKGRYPRHRWPDEPWAEKPSLKTKNAFSRSPS
ncbi:ATP-dependent helicase HrpB [Parafrankia sp. BMG5.11]|uniref:ATP-dependent helicase HrpB n=1 Tax=Parafrankia sp. BMG5.11 TaxID=222540 RepID=UPI00103ACCF4|nr:ATP-dependent helicase HrpB [Parafrankia sp. BMG5.11]TCJ39024.1 ATP-dependent helicase HrpB [Parafrankia sp. BMG5.11]